MRNLLVVVFLLFSYGFAQERQIPTGERETVAMQPDTVVDGKILIYQGEQQKEYTSFYEQGRLDFRQNSLPDGIPVSEKDKVGFTLQVPFVSLQGKTGFPYSGARLKEVRCSVFVYLTGRDFVIVQDIAQADQIQVPERERVYQVSFVVENFPAQWQDWQQQAPEPLLPFHFAFKDLAENKLLMTTLEGKLVGALQRFGKAHLVAWEMQFQYEYAKIEYQPTVKKVLVPNPEKVLQDKTARELDQAFANLNSIFAAADLRSSEVQVALYSLKNSLNNIIYYTQNLQKREVDSFQVLLKKVETIRKQIENQEIARKELTPALNEIRLTLIQSFAGLFEKQANQKTPEQENTSQEN